MVMTVVNSVSKKAYFILTYTTVFIEGIARLFLHYVWRLSLLMSFWIKVYSLLLSLPRSFTAYSKLR